MSMEPLEPWRNGLTVMGGSSACGLFGCPAHGLVPCQPVMTCRAPQVKGKCNAISIDKCQKTGVVFEDVIAVCELVNCTSVQVCGCVRHRSQARLAMSLQDTVPRFIMHVYQC